ncbi:MAG: adenylate/guanylate cyclase domain-containing protein [Azoarcus sp.]|jgi:class 3 adenylate cyclase|nr:adenylate/guanylate cyclase domain-containing protein [Azoarcus sp.]
MSTLPDDGLIDALSGDANRTGESASQMEKAVLFADLTGSTKLFESQGNTVATRVVTRCTQMLGKHFARVGGHVVKYLGDGLLVLFDASETALDAAARTRDVLYDFNIEQLGRERTSLGLKVGIEYGSVIEQHGDCYGDAVNVAARLGDRAESNEILLGEALYARLPEMKRTLCTSIDRIAVKGKTGLLKVWRYDWRLSAETTITSPLSLLNERVSMSMLQRADLDIGGRHVQLLSTDGALLIGRAENCGMVVDDRRVSRRHARIEWIGGQCTLTDFSSNGTWVRFGHEVEPVILKRDNCVLHGRGTVGLGAAPEDLTASVFNFQIISDGI